MTYYHLSAFQLSQFNTYFIWGYALMSIPAGFIVDMWGVKKSYKLSVYLIFLFIVCFFISKIFWLDLIFRFLIGLFGCFSFILVMKVIFDKVPNNLRGLYVGMTFSICTLGAVFGDSILNDFSSYNSFLFFVSLILVFGLFLILLDIFIMKGYTDKKSDINIFMYVKPIFVSAVILGVIAGIMYLPFALWQGLWGKSFIIQASGLNNVELMEIIFFMCLGWIIGAITIGKLSDHYDYKAILGFFILLEIISNYLINYFIVVSVSDYIVLYVLIFGFSSSAILILYMMSGVIFNKAPSVGIAIVNACLTFLICLIFPILGLFIYNPNTTVLNAINNSLYDYRHAEAIINTLLLGSLLLWLFYLKYNKIMVSIKNPTS